MIDHPLLNSTRFFNRDQVEADGMRVPFFSFFKSIGLMLTGQQELRTSFPIVISYFVPGRPGSGLKQKLLNLI